jgi:hypothetical protein
VGRKWKGIQKLCQNSGTNVYVIKSRERVPSDQKQMSTIYLTGKKKNVAATKAKLDNIINQKVHSTPPLTK